MKTAMPNKSLDSNPLKIVVTPSNGNIFADIGVPDPELALQKAKLAAKIWSIICERKLNQTQAAELMGVSQPQVSHIVNGRLRGITLDRLCKMLNVLGQEVVMTIRPRIEMDSK
jgi:predicted XRE-type DNA-binding protein